MVTMILLTHAFCFEGPSKHMGFDEEALDWSISGPWQESCKNQVQWYTPIIPATGRRRKRTESWSPAWAWPYLKNKIRKQKGWAGGGSRSNGWNDRMLAQYAQGQSPGPSQFGISLRLGWCWDLENAGDWVCSLFFPWAQGTGELPSSVILNPGCKLRTGLHALHTDPLTQTIESGSLGWCLWLSTTRTEQQLAQTLETCGKMEEVGPWPTYWAKTVELLTSNH
jgi:hypothetical protein